MTELLKLQGMTFYVTLVLVVWTTRPGRHPGREQRAHARLGTSGHERAAKPRLLLVCWSLYRCACVRTCRQVRRQLGPNHRLAFFDLFASIWISNRRLIIPQISQQDTIFLNIRIIFMHTLQIVQVTSCCRMFSAGRHWSGLRHTRVPGHG